MYSTAGEMSATGMLQFGKRVTLRVLVFLLVSLLLFVLIEGLSGTALLFADLRLGAVRREISDRKYMHYDSELGWVNLPNMNLQDVFGPGMYLHTDSRGFRNTVPLSTNAAS